MILFVQDHIVIPPYQGTDNAQIALEPRGEGHRPLLMEKPCQPFLQLYMHIQCPIQKTGAGASGTILFYRLDRRLYHLWMTGQAQIIVAAQHDPPLVLHNDLGTLTGLQCSEIGVNALFPVCVGYARRIAFFKDVHCLSPLM